MLTHGNLLWQSIHAMSGSEGLSRYDVSIAWVRDRLAHFKCPSRVEFTSELPRNSTGKLLKRDLRATYGG